MKYIRTKDGIYEVENENFNYVGKEYKRATWNKSQLVINQADTIEELCDEFIGVLDNGKGSHIWYNEQLLGITEWETFEEYMEKIWFYAKANVSLNEILYGAIWTDKGLIYVAKMNDKGELELI